MCACSIAPDQCEIMVKYRGSHPPQAPCDRCACSTEHTATGNLIRQPVHTGPLLEQSHTRVRSHTQKNNNNSLLEKDLQLALIRLPQPLFRNINNIPILIAHLPRHLVNLTLSIVPIDRNGPVRRAENLSWSSETGRLESCGVRRSPERVEVVCVHLCSRKRNM